jgi:hypothetical protein
MFQALLRPASSCLSPVEALTIMPCSVVRTALFGVTVHAVTLS